MVNLTPTFTLPGETWRPALVEGYFVSDLGRLVSTRRSGPGGGRGAPRLMTLSPGAGGYVRSGLAGVSHLIHLLVAAAFLPPAPSPSHEIAFADGDVTNCRASNLSWSTKREKVTRARADGTWDASSRISQAKLNEDTVRALRADLGAGMRNVDAAKKYGIHRTGISHVKTGRAWSHVV